MMLFYTNSVAHFAKKINIKKGKFVIKRFSDGEVYVKINENVDNKTVWVMGNTNPPSENILELVFLLDALKRNGAKIKLFIPYFGYARQDRVVEQGECLSAEVICNMLKHYDLEDVFVIHMHSSRIKSFLKYKNVVPYTLLHPVMKNIDLIVAPDKGAEPEAQHLGSIFNIPVVIMEKKRPSHEKVFIKKSYNNVRGRVLLIDDIIASGKTLAVAAQKLRNAKEIIAIATHGIFSGNANQNLRNKKIKMIYVTNTLPQKPRTKVKLLDISKLIEKIIKRGSI